MQIFTPNLAQINKLVYKFKLRKQEHHRQDGHVISILFLKREKYENNRTELCYGRQREHFK